MSDHRNSSVDNAPPSTSSTADPRRRRLLQGATALAPAILTLRSGAALAATSCTGILNPNATAPGSVTDPSSQMCIAAVNDCGNNRIRGLAGAASPIQDCSTDEEGNTSCSGYYCPLGTPTLVSGAAYTSLISS